LQTLPENLTIKPDRPRSFAYAAGFFFARARTVLLSAGAFGHLPYFGAKSQWRNHAYPTPTETPMADTIFGKIIAGQIPCHRVYEDERVLAFLDINPLTRGHTLVVPKEPAETLDQLSDDSAAALGRVLPRICRAVIAATGVSQYNVLENNGAGAHQAVLHVHFHIIPKPDPVQGLGIGWPARSLDPKDASLLVKSITEALQKAP
jgi:histidine triad (HIT) family protein